MKTNDPGRHVERLPNGLTVLLQELRHYPVVLLDIWIRVGSRDERKDQWGLSHFLEHMIFNGSGEFSKDEFRRILFELGGENNAATWNDCTDYFIMAPSEHFETALGLHRALVTSPLLADGEFRREKEVVLEEIRLYEDDPEETLRDKSEIRLFKSLGYNHPILGSAEVINRMTPEVMRTYFREHYTPEKMLLVAVGDFDIGEILPRIREEYSTPAQPVDTAPEESPDQPLAGPQVVTLSGDIDATYLSILFKAPPLRDVQTYALDVLMEAIGGGRSARLNARLFEELALVTDISAYNRSYMDASKLAIEAELKDSANLQPAVDEILKILSRVAADGIANEEIERAKTRLLAGRVFHNENLTGVADFYGQNVMLGDLELADKYMDRILSVTGEQILDVARRYLRPDNMVLGVNRPEKSAELSVSLRQFEAPSYPALDLRSPHGEITRRFGSPAARSDRMGPVHREQLPNGLVWLHQRNPANASAAIHLYARGGLAFETWETNGLGALTHRARWKGTRSLPAAELNLAIDSLGARISTDCEHDYISVEGLFLARDFEKGFRLLADMVLEPAFPADEIEKVKQEVMGIILQNQDNTWEVSLNGLRLEIFGKDHPYGRPPYGRMDAVEGLTVDDVLGFHNTVWSPENIVICAVGDIARDEASRIVMETFGTLSPSDSAIPSLSAPSEPAGEKLVRTVRDKSQIRISLGRPGPSVFDPDYPAARVLDVILGGTSYSRLFVSLREKSGLAYDVYSDVERRRSPGLFYTYMGTAGDKCERAIDGIRREYRKLIVEGPAPEEIDRARNWLRGHFLLWRQGNRAIATSLGTSEVLGLPYDFDSRLLDECRRVTGEDVVRAARKYCDPDNVVISIVGPSHNG